MKKWLIIPITFLVLILAVALFFFFHYVDNTTLQLTTYQISNPKIPSEFDGFRIAQVSDLHNTVFGEDNADLLALLRESDPDIIVFTGDQLDARRMNLDVVSSIIRQAAQIAPCYLVTGNHEGSVPGTQAFYTQLETDGIAFLDNEVTELEANGAAINLIGLTDATMNERYYTHGGKVALETTLQELYWDEDRFSILLAHQPEYFYVYERNDIDLALCGHVHGGQIRINGLGLVGPSKELFPEYHCGVYTLDEATLVVSRGLGNSVFPWRVNNPPELVIVELVAEQ